jgi:[ribosomal protein S18]-alanine N-acetyltransferase
MGNSLRLNVRSATVADIPAMLDLERQCPAAAHWSRQQYEDLFLTHEDLPRRLVLVLESADGDGRGAAYRLESPASSRVLGFLIASQIGPEWELENIVVAPASRRKGLATRLFTTLLARARETNSQRVFLEVRESNQPARALYVRLGFEESGRRKLYYANPQEDAILYRLALTHTQTRHQPA